MVLDDEPIIRKKIRLKALGNGNRTVYIVSDEAKWKAVRNAMRLSNEQMERMSAIPDILPKPRTGGGGGGGSIKKDIHLNRVWAIAQGGYLNVMPGQFSGYTWSTTSRPTRRYTHSSLFGMGNDTLVLNSLRSVVPNMVGGVLYVTPLQAERGLKKGTLDPALRLDLVMGRFIATLGDKIEQQIKFNNLPGNSMKNIVFAERYGLSSPNVHSTFVNMYSREFPDKVKQFNADAAKLAAEIIDRYPLLFADSKDAILRYVEMIDAEETA